MGFVYFGACKNKPRRSVVNRIAISRIEQIGPIRQHQAGHQRHVFVYQIQAEGTLDQVVQARVEGKAGVQDLLMEYCKMKRKPLV